MPGSSSLRRAVRITCWLLATVCGALLLVAMRRHGPPAPNAVSFCLFRRMAGIPCPLCGLSRASFALARGAWREMFRMHPLAPLLALECGAVWLASGAWAAGWRLPLPQPRLERYAERLILANAVFFVLLWGGRLYFHTLRW
jgi:Protein of unknown function (DUF2752)